MFSDSSKTEQMFLPRNLQSEVLAMKETLLLQLRQLIKNLEIEKLDESQLHIAIGFFRSLFDLND